MLFASGYRFWTFKSSANLFALASGTALSTSLKNIPKQRAYVCPLENHIVERHLRRRLAADDHGRLALGKIQFEERNELVVDTCFADCVHETLDVHFVKCPTDIVQIYANVVFHVECGDPLAYEQRNEILRTQSGSERPLRRTKSI